MNIKKVIKIALIVVVSVFLILLIIGLLLPQSEIDKMNKEEAIKDSLEKVEDVKTLNTQSYTLNANDTVGDIVTIINKTGKFFMEGKTDAVIAIVNANLNRFDGIDKAELLSQRGGAYFSLGKKEEALKDYESAIELDVNNSSLINNLIETYVSLGNKSKANEYLEKLKKVKNPSQFDIENCEKLISKM